MKLLIATGMLLMLPLPAFSYVSGVDDSATTMDASTQQRIDAAVTTYYLSPSVDKVDTVLDIMTASDVLRKKTSWAPLTGFLTVVFANHPEHIMQWLSRNDYNTYGIDIIISALLHAKRKEEALTFAKAEQWDDGQLARLRDTHDAVDLKALPVVLPGHIDTLWGAFFASGDAAYVNEIINVLFMKALPDSTMERPDHADILGENKALAAKTLKYYAASQDTVKAIIEKRIKNETDKNKKGVLKSLLAG